MFYVNTCFMDMFYVNLSHFFPILIPSLQSYGWCCHSLLHVVYVITVSHIVLFLFVINCCMSYATCFAAMAVIIIMEYESLSSSDMCSSPEEELLKSLKAMEQKMEMEKSVGRRDFAAVARGSREKQRGGIEKNSKICYAERDRLSRCSPSQWCYKVDSRKRQLYTGLLVWKQRK